MAEARTEKIEVRITPADKKAIVKAADAAGMSTSEYMRAAALTAMALSANPHAFRMLGQGLAGLVQELIPRGAGNKLVPATAAAMEIAKHARK
jgi:hypothetical protein